MKITCYLLALSLLVALCAASGCTASHNYASSSESGHLSCDYYTDRLTITWLIELDDPTLRIDFEFTSFDTEANYDFVYLYDGTSSSAPLMGQFSGSLIPGPFITSANSLYVVFTSDEYVEGDGFYGTWTSFQSGDGSIVPCTTSQSYNLSGDEGSFGCDGYGLNIFSTWSITGDSGERIVLTFDSFDTERNYDVLTVYDGPSSSSQVVGTFSGTDIPEPITASGSSLYIEFSSDYSITESGFHASWTSLIEFADPCFNSTQMILIPYSGYVGCPYGYGNNVNTTWLIALFGDFIIELDFLSMNLAVGDYVTVYDGSVADNTANVLGMYTSTQDTPPPVVSSGNRMLITLFTNAAITSDGFTASYQSVHALQEGGCSRSGSNTLTAPQDSLGCEGYLNGVTEEWLLVAQDEHQVVNLVWHSFDTEENHDIMYVYDGENDSAPLIYQASGINIPDPVTSSTQHLYVKFVADTNNIQGSGFSAVYESIETTEPGDATSCSTSHDYVLTADEGLFGCDGYSNDVTVTWKIEVEDGFIIMLDWLSFFTEGGYDYVTVYDGPDDSHYGLGSWSGAFRPPPLTSSSNYLYVVFTSDAGVTRTGFTVQYDSIFSGYGAGSCYNSQTINLNDDNGSFGCTGYDSNVEVAWSITTSSGTIIDLEFNSFEIEYNYDTLTIYDGSSSNSPRLAEYSGYVIPEPVHSTSNHMYVVFSSDASIEYDGFEATYSASQTGHNIPPCESSVSETLTSSEGAFGCSGYSNNVDSSWSITAPSEKRITLTFTLLDTELYYDYVKIYDGSSTHDTLLGTYSGSSIPPPLTSTSNNFYITFHSDSSVSSYEGFVLEYVEYGSFTSACVNSGTTVLSDPTGTFGCDGYENSVTYEWQINSYGQIGLNFETFNTEQNYDTVTIYDGNSDSAPVIAVYSGTHASPVTSSGNHLFVVFSSDSSITRDGFRASYATIIVNDYAADEAN